MTLVPKKSERLSVGAYPLISLIHEIIKIFSKTLANFMEELISRQQSAFIQGRFIGDGVLTAAEVISQCRKSNHPGLILKLDIQKAFDTIDWNLLLDLLRTRGFGAKWCNWILNLLSLTKIALLINWEPTC